MGPLSLRNLGEVGFLQLSTLLMLRHSDRPGRHVFCFALHIAVLGLVILAHVEGAGQLAPQRPVARAAPVVHDGLDFL